MKKVSVIIEKNNDGFWGQILEIPEVFCHAENISSLKLNCDEVYELFCEANGIKCKTLEYEFVIDLTQFFELNDYINISNLAKRIGINQSLLRQYAKGIKYPGIKQVEKIQKAVHQVGQELIATKLKPAM